MAREDITSLDTIRDLIHKDPFVAFTVVMTSGDRYKIENPESLAIGSSQLHYYLPKSDRAVHMQLSQISTLEEGLNGKAKSKR